MINSIVTCVVFLQFLYVHPEGKTYWNQVEVTCKVINERPCESDGRKAIKVDCTEAFNKARITRHHLNRPFRWMIYREDCH